MNDSMTIALPCLRRGWYVFPCWPPTNAKNKDGKEPLYEGAYKDATLDESQVRAWVEKTPAANIGVATGKSGA